MKAHKESAKLNVAADKDSLEMWRERSDTPAARQVYTPPARARQSSHFYCSIHDVEWAGGQGCWMCEAADQADSRVDEAEDSG
jgi:hypothetical protein